MGVEVATGSDLELKANRCQFLPGENNSSTFGSAPLMTIELLILSRIDHLFKVHQILLFHQA